MSASVFPAPAGMSRSGVPNSDMGTRFPRTCGDEPDGNSSSGVLREFSPHLRG